MCAYTASHFYEDSLIELGPVTLHTVVRVLAASPASCPGVTTKDVSVTDGVPHLKVVKFPLLLQCCVHRVLLSGDFQPTR